jgi:hypothetical protein
MAQVELRNILTEDDYQAVMGLRRKWGEDLLMLDLSEDR